MRIIALIVAAGDGSRAGGGIPKQFRELGGKSMLLHTVEALLSHPAVETAQVVIGPTHANLYLNALLGLPLPEPVFGANTRQQSVFNGLQALARGDAPPDMVLIHDAARPFVTHALIDRLLDALNEHDGAQCGAGQGGGDAPRLVHLLDGVDDGQAGHRAALRAVQTPQAFRFPAILDAHRQTAEAGAVGMTDDAAVAERSGLEVVVVEGDPANFKITTMDDIARADALLMPEDDA